MVYGSRTRIVDDRSSVFSTFLLAFLLFLPVLLCVGPVPVSAQESSDPPAADRLPPVVARVVAAEDMTGPVSSYQRVVRDAMEVILERRGFFREGVEPEVDGEDGEIVPLEYRYHLVGFLPRLHLAVAVWDADLDTLVTGATAVARANVTLYSAVDELLALLDPAIDGYLERRNNRDAGPIPVALAGPMRPPPDTGFRFIESVSGVALPGDLVLIEGAVVPVRVAADRYYPQELVVEISGPRPELPSVELQPLRRFAVLLQYGFPRMLGAVVGARYYALPDRVFVGGELGIGYSGFYGMTPSQVIHLDTRFQAGMVPLGDPSWLVQPVLSAGVGLVTSLVSYSEGEAPPYLDWYWNVLNVSAEVGRGSLRWYLRTGFSYYFETGRGLWDDGVNPDMLAPELAAGMLWRW